MEYLNVIAPLLTILAVFIAYIGGKHAGKEKAENEQKEKEEQQYDDAGKIIANNANLTDDDFDAWLSKRTKK